MGVPLFWRLLKDNRYNIGASHFGKILLLEASNLDVKKCLPEDAGAESRWVRILLLGIGVLLGYFNRKALLGLLVSKGNQLFPFFCKLTCR